MSEVSDAFMKGIISGFTSSMDRDVSNMATKEATTPGEAAGDGEGRKYQTGPNSGVRYSLPNSTRGSELMYMLAHTANAYLDSGDMGKAMNVGSAAAQGLHNRNWRATQAAAMDAKGYDPQGIQAWIESGDNKDLVTGMGDQIRTIGGKNVRLNAKQAADYDQQQFSNNNLNAYQQAEVGIHQTELNQSQQRLNLENQSQAETVRHNYAQEGLEQQRMDNATTEANKPAPLTWKDPNTGELGTVVTNAKGTPQINTAGLAIVRMPNGETKQININQSKSEAAGKDALAGLQFVQEFENNPDLMSNIGGYGIKRGVNEYLNPEENRDLYSNIKQLNSLVKSTVENTLFVDSGGKPVTNSQIAAAQGKFGTFNASMSPERFQQLLTTLKDQLQYNIDHAQQPQYNAQAEAAGGRYKSMQPNQENLGARTGLADQPVGAPSVGTVTNGYRFKGGNPNDQNNWERM